MMTPQPDMELVDSLNVRIITTLGHVDHGKTTLMDALLAANNIISSRMAGKMRYMDSREDEQERGITMESSAVSLKFYVTEQDDNGERTQKCYIINMIDTPGHVDFSTEVSTASQLCDGALVLVDVVEGVCTQVFLTSVSADPRSVTTDQQTVAVLRQSWIDGLRPVLVINKLDRLVTDLKLTPLEAYSHLSRLIEQVNAVMGSFFASERMEDDLHWREERERQLLLKKDSHLGGEIEATFGEFEEKDDEDIYFAPQRGNVIFASAIDGWGFRIGKFAQIFSAKLGIKEINLRRVLWGDFFLDPKTKKVIGYKHLRGRPLKPLFVQIVLENIWAVYDAVVINPNPEKIAKIVMALDLKIPSRDLKSKDTRHLLTLVFSQWLSLSTCVVQTVIDVVPPPSIAQTTRIPKMLYPNTIQGKLEEEGLCASKFRSSTSLLAYVSKMFAVPEALFPENKNKRVPGLSVEKSQSHGIPIASNVADSALDRRQLEGTTGDIDVLLGFARLYSGTIRTGTRVYCVLPKYQNALDPEHPHNLKHIDMATVDGLYMMMGRELVAVDHVCSGNIFAIRGLGGKVWRSATICAPGEIGVEENPPTRLQACFINLGRANPSAPPIVRVALEPIMSTDMPQLIRGLKLLSQSDPCVETFQQKTGEHVILAAGELHLERCLRDLRERFARVEIQASKPIVPFRETAVRGTDILPSKSPNAVRGTVRGSSSYRLVTFTIRASPLPKAISTFLLENYDSLKKLQQARKTGVSQVNEDFALVDDEEGLDIYGEVSRRPTVKPDHFWSALHDTCKAVGGEWADVKDNIMGFGPQKVGGCVLIDSRHAMSNSLRNPLARVQTEQVHSSDADELAIDFYSLMETGFQLAVSQGPLCAEPMEGMAYFIESLEMDVDGLQKEISQGRIGQVTGSLISAVRDACKNGFLDWSPRLMLAMYTCDIQASTDVLGKVYSVVAKRRGRIVAEEMKEGTTLFSVRALLPVVESFGFADDIRKRTSGAASPQLIFSGYELLDQDPFWVPTTGEELEELGEKADRFNVAKTYMDSVRERKGMFVDRKLFESAEKQRTLKR